MLSAPGAQHVCHAQHFAKCNAEGVSSPSHIRAPKTLRGSMLSLGAEYYASPSPPTAHTHLVVLRVVDFHYLAAYGRFKFSVVVGEVGQHRGRPPCSGRRGEHSTHRRGPARGVACDSAHQKNATGRARKAVEEGWGRGAGIGRASCCCLFLRSLQFSPAPTLAESRGLSARIAATLTWRTCWLFSLGDLDGAFINRGPANGYMVYPCLYYNQRASFVRITQRQTNPDNRACREVKATGGNHVCC